MERKKPVLDNIVLIVGMGVFLWVLLLPKPSANWVYLDTLKYASTTLKGQMPFSDFAAMVVGFRALYNRTDPYPVLGTAFRDLGIDWDVRHGSNHPPTSYLLAAPVAFMPWPWASAVWAWLMLCLIVLSYRFYGLSWKLSLGLMPLTLFWPPASASLGQVTIVWMFGVAMAYYFRRSKLFWSGVSVGLASASKYLPALLMIAFIIKRKWMAILGFVSFWIAALAMVLILNASAIQRYVEENRHTSVAIMQRPDNAAPLLVGYRYGGWLGLAAIICFYGAIVFANRECFSGEKDYPSTRAWMLLSYFAVACIPIFWIYSLMPLLPVIAFLVKGGRVATTILAVGAVLIPSILIQAGESSILAIAGAVAILGLALIFDVLPMKILQRQWRPDHLIEAGAR